MTGLILSILEESLRTETGCKTISEVCSILQSPFLQDKTKSCKGRSTFAPEAFPWPVGPPAFGEQCFGMGQTPLHWNGNLGEGKEQWDFQKSALFWAAKPALASLPLAFPEGKNQTSSAGTGSFDSEESWFWNCSNQGLHMRQHLPLSRACAESLS